ncbi:Calbindin-32 [Schistosoma japonicum]|nr:Calbindin-32 [Schistosoma japonicum]
MARLLPVKENYLCRPIFKDANGTIEDEELSGFLKDLLELAQEDYDEADLEFFKKVILNQWDVNNDGKINRDELKMMLMQQSRLLGDKL